MRVTGNIKPSRVQEWNVRRCSARGSRPTSPLASSSRLWWFLIAACLFALLGAPGFLPNSILFFTSADNPESAEKPHSSQNQTEPLLEPGRPREGELAPGQRKTYRVSIRSGELLRVTVEQQGIDLSVSLAGRYSRLIAEMDGPYGDRETESVSMIAPADGEYLIELRETKSAQTPGRFIITVDRPRQPTQTDLARIAGERAFMEAQNFGSRKSPLRAIGKYNEALAYWRSAGDRYEEAKTLHCIAKAIWDMSRSKRQADVVDFDTRAIKLCQEIGDQRGEAYALKHLGFIYLYSDQIKSREFSERAVKLWQAQADTFNEATTLNNIGGSYDNAGDVETALKYYYDSLRLEQKVKDLSGTANVLNNIGQIYDRLGESQKALKHYKQVIDSLTGVKPLDSRAVKALAAALNNRGYTYLALGEPGLALKSCSKSLPLQRSVPYPPGEISTLLNIGYAHLELGHRRTALSYYKQARKVSERTADKTERAYALAYEGQAYASLGKSQIAYSSYQAALKIFTENKDKVGAVIVLNGIAAVLALQGRETARKTYEQALAMWRSLKDPRGEAAALYGIARIDKDQRRFAEACRNAEEAIGIIETLRARVVSRELRSSYLASVHDYYGLGVDVLMNLHKLHPSEGYDSRALRLSEQGQARSFLESLVEIGKEIRGGVDPELLDREQSLERQIEGKAQKQVELLSAGDKEKQAALLERELESLIDERKAIEEQIRIQSPRYAALVQPQPVGVEEIQEKLLDPETLILKYELGEQRSYLWLVGKSHVESYELPGRAVIEASARQVYKLISSAESTLPEGKAAYWRKAEALSNMILGQAAGQLGGKRLVIVPEGALQYVPFSALPIPGPALGSAASGTSDVVPLAVAHEIISLPSVSVLAALRAEVATRKAAGKGVAVFADPVFKSDDARVSSSKKAPESADNQPVERSLRSPLREFDLCFDELERLQYSREEAEAIRSLYPDARVELDFDASRANARHPALGDFKYVHFATHGLLDTKHPDLSRLVLSTVNSSGARQNGCLMLNDIYNLRLSADLVVLSACSTALGKDIKGEGLVGLTRGFMYAGVARVVASLWNVDDKRTAELMKRFYEKMLKENMQPAAALRAAQLEMWRSENNSPYYWGAFILQGEWRARPESSR